MKSSRKGGFSSSVLLTCLCNLCNLLSQQDLCVPPDSSYLCNSCYFHRLVLKHLFLHHSLVLKHLFLHLLWYSFCFFLTFFFFFSLFILFFIALFFLFLFLFFITRLCYITFVCILFFPLVLLGHHCFCCVCVWNKQTKNWKHASTRMTYMHSNTLPSQPSLFFLCFSLF